MEKEEIGRKAGKVDGKREREEVEEEREGGM